MTPYNISTLFFAFLLIFGCTPKVDEVVGPGGPGKPGSNAASSLQIPEAGLKPLENSQHLDVLLQEIGNAGVVLLGEAAYGTAEFYTWRAAITRRLIAEKGFRLVAIEGDWPAAYAVNQYIQGSSSQPSAAQALAGFKRWPTAMWANQETALLTDWLRDYNSRQAPHQQVGFYGLDIQSLWESLESLKNNFTEADPQTLAAIDEARACLEPFERNTLAYAQATKGGGGCAEALNKVYAAVQRQVSGQPGESAFNAARNAAVVLNAHKYYQATVLSNLQSWNIRGNHMLETIDQLLNRHGAQAKIIVWAHNSLVGDARYTRMAEEGMKNLGQMVREKYKQKGVYLVGFGAYQGTVMAASSWGAPLVSTPVPQALPGSWEALLHERSASNKLAVLREWRRYGDLTKPRAHRTLGAVYVPDQEAGNYVPTDLPNRYDAYLYLDRTQALPPLYPSAGMQGDLTVGSK